MSEKTQDKMAPLHLDILIHYYTSLTEYEGIPTNKTRTDYTYDLAKMGLLFTPKTEDKSTLLFEITDTGKKKVESLLSTLEQV